MSVKCWASVPGAGQYPFSPSQYSMLAGARAHSAWRNAADSEMEVSAYFTSVHITASDHQGTNFKLCVWKTNHFIFTFTPAVRSKKLVIISKKL